MTASDFHTLTQWLRARLPQSPQDVTLRDDIDMNLSDTTPAAPVAAAVLLPVIAHTDPTLLFTRRTATLARHSGQVSFPGGRSEPGRRFAAPDRVA